MASQSNPNMDLVLWQPATTISPDSLPKQGFNKLPFELRALVWKEASMMDPRLVYYEIGGGKPPAVLLVCRESRLEGLKHYVRVDLPQWMNKLSKKFSIFINPTIDTLFRDDDFLAFDQTIVTNDLIAIPAGPGQVALPRFRKWAVLAPIWSRNLKRLAITLELAAYEQLDEVLPALYETGPLWGDLASKVPLLEELVVIMLTRGRYFTNKSTLSDLIELDVSNVDELCKATFVGSTQEEQLRNTFEYWGKRKEFGYDRSIKLTVMRTRIERTVSIKGIKKCWQKRVDEEKLFHLTDSVWDGKLSVLRWSP